MSAADEARDVAREMLDARGIYHTSAAGKIAALLVTARREALAEAAAIVRGEVHEQHYRKWPWYGPGSRAETDQLVQFCDAAADEILRLQTRL